MEQMITGVMGGIFSLLPEVVPGFSEKWAQLENKYKLAIRAWLGLLVAVVLALLQYLFGMDYGLPTAFGPEAVIAIVKHWFTFVLASEGAYQMLSPAFPRKRT